MKFVHISDVYLGAQPDPGKEWSEDRKKELYEALDNIIQVCLDEKVGLLMIAGNLFAGQPTTEDLVDLDERLLKLEKTRTVILCGYVDYMGADSAYNGYEFKSKTVVLPGGKTTNAYLKGINTCVTGFSYDRPEYTEDIIDEISMIGLELFYYLIRAIPSGAKVLLIGDYGQLESIGSGNIAYDILHSDSIPSILLTKIHRQAAKSGIISESLKIRQGIQLVEEDWTGDEIRGDLQDLRIKCFLDKSNTYYEVLKAFSAELEKEDFNILNTQIIVPIKTRGQCNTYELNNAIQELYNPNSASKKEATSYRNGKLYILRVGDKVINRVNNYKTDPPIYNGNIGILKRFDVNDDMKEVMIINFVGIGEVELISEYWNNIELAYALTCHSVQGSQFEYVIIGLDFDSYTLLTKELVYTAITRGMKRAMLIAQTGALRMAISQEGVSNKQTHLQECLYDIDNPKIIF